MSENTLDDLLDKDLDDLADLPSFKPYPEGSHRARIKFNEKVVNNKPSVEVKLIGIASEELAKPDTDKPIEVGQETSCLFTLTKKDGTANEVAQGKLKEILSKLKEAVGGSRSREIMQNANEVEVLVTTKLREKKDDAGKGTGEYGTDIVDIAVV
jgi:hypothetical protein